MATEAQVERALRAMIRNLAKAAPDAGAIPDRSILCVLTDLDAAFWAETRGSRMLGLRKAETTEHTDVRITARSDDLIALIEGRLGVGSAFLTGRVSIDASPVDLMRMRRLF